jgi:hypothetical protein
MSCDLNTGPGSLRHQMHTVSRWLKMLNSLLSKEGIYPSQRIPVSFVHLSCDLCGRDVHE